MRQLAGCGFRICVSAREPALENKNIPQATGELGTERKAAEEGYCTDVELEVGGLIELDKNG